MRRRDFLATAAASVMFHGQVRAEVLPADLKVTRIVSFDLPTRRSKVAGKNSEKDVHGDRSSDRMVRLFTNVGVEGLGNCRAGKEALAKLLGKNPLEGFLAGARQMPGPLGSQTMPLWDLAGKLLKKPVHALLGKEGPQRVPVYDGSIYFADLLPQYADQWQDRFKDEIDMGLRAGHRAFKIKIGRGRKWMDRAAGDARDVEVVELIRRHAGKDVLLGVDANNGYDLAGTKRFLERAGGLDLAFIEEPFPEQVEQCLELKRFMAQHGWKTLLADGETQHDLDAYQPFIAAKAIDVFQADMNAFGIEGILREAAMAKPQGLLVGAAQLGFAGRLLPATARRPGSAQLLPRRARPAGQRRPGRRGLQDRERGVQRARCAGLRPDDQRGQVPPGKGPRGSWGMSPVGCGTRPISGV